jgi:hypothetical protein
VIRDPDTVSVTGFVGRLTRRCKFKMKVNIGETGIEDGNDSGSC